MTLQKFPQTETRVERLCNETVSIKQFLFKKCLCLDVKLTKQIMETETETF